MNYRYIILQYHYFSPNSLVTSLVCFSFRGRLQYGSEYFCKFFRKYFIEKVLTLILQRIKIANVFLDSSMVEHTAVNRGVVGSSPTRGANNLCMK